MTIEDDTEWLRAQLKQESFHENYPQKWVAALDGTVVFYTADRVTMDTWLESNDSDRRGVLAFCDPRVLV